MRPMKELHITDNIKELVRTAIVEDVRGGDITSLALVPDNAQAKGRIVFKQDGILCGNSLGEFIFEELGHHVSYIKLKQDGDVVSNGRSLHEYKCVR